MAHEFITIKQLAREALPRLMENLVFPNLVYRDYDEAFEGNLGNVIRVRKPVVLEAKEFDAAQGIQPQDIREESVEVTLDKIATVDIDVSALQGATNINDLDRQFITPAAAALAQKINHDGLGLYADIPYAGGTAGTTPAALSDLSAVRRMLNANLAPVSPRYAVWDVEADAKFTEIPAIVNAEKSGSTEALREGSIGKIYGLDNYMSQAVRRHTTGITAATAVKVNGAVSAGATTLSIDGTALTGKLVKGDLLEIGGAYYTVTADSAEAASNAIANVAVYPALPDLKDNADVTLVGDHTMRTVNQQGETITDYDLSKGVLTPAKVIREDAAPIDNVTKWAWAEDDYEDVMMYVETPEETEGYVSQEAKELEAIKTELKGLKDGIDYLIGAVNKLV